MAAARNRTIALLITLMVVSAACMRQQGPNGPAAQLPTASSEASTSEATATPTPDPSEVANPDPFAIPADPNDIDKVYVARVLDALSGAYGKAALEIVRAGGVTPRVEQVLARTHTRVAAKSGAADFARVVQQAGTTEVFRTQPAQARISVRSVVSAQRDCVFALVEQDLSGLFRGGTRPITAYYHLTAGNTEISGENPTPWKIAGNVLRNGTGTGVENPCASGA